MKNSSIAWFLRLLLALVASAGLAYWAASSHDEFELAAHRTDHIRQPITFSVDDERVSKVEPEAASAGVPVGARVHSVNDAAYTGGWQWENTLNAARPGDTIRVGFTAPDGSPHSAQITLAPMQPSPGLAGTRVQAWQFFFINNFIPLLCMLIGYWVVFIKADEPNAWLLLTLLVFPSLIFSFPTGFATGTALTLRIVYYNIFQSFAPLAILPFAIYFPERSRIDIRAPWLKWLVLGPAFVAACIDLCKTCRELFLGGNPGWLLRIADPASTAESALYLLCVALYFVILADKLRFASSADARRRLRVLLAGTSVGIGSLLLVFVLLPALGYTRGVQTHPWVYYLGALFFMLAPLTLAYVVLVQRAMDVRVLVRQGTRYALARASIWVIQAAIIALLTMQVLIPAFAKHSSGGGRTVEIILSFAFIFWLRILVTPRGKKWVDRKFFREAYDSEQVLNELAEEVRQYTESKPLLETVSRRVSATLHVSSMAMLLRDGRRYCVAQTVGISAAEAAELSLPATSASVRKLSNERAPVQLYRQDPDAWYMLAAADEKHTLDTLGAELLLPLPGRNSLMGIMMLGPKQSEAAYSKSDLKLLQAVATQTGLALEVGELAHSLASAAAQRERAVRELELAREVQERLFPQTMPSFPAMSIAGACRPAFSVGGDYYDVFSLDDGRLGIAIGDVSGKGISAALLMAGMRASMRGITIGSGEGVGSLMGRMNRLICEASADNRFATLFFAIFDPATGLLECVNAGHNPPLLLRADGDPKAHWLDADGPVVGILEGATYGAKRLYLAPGDLLVTYTDGISEAMTHDEQEWGEERLLTAALQSGGASAGEVLASVLAQTDAFTAGAPQHDDMTLLVLKLNPASI